MRGLQKKIKKKKREKGGVTSRLVEGWGVFRKERGKGEAMQAVARGSAGGRGEELSYSKFRRGPIYAVRLARRQQGSSAKLEAKLSRQRVLVN